MGYGIQTDTCYLAKKCINVELEEELYYWLSRTQANNTDLSLNSYTCQRSVPPYPLNHLQMYYGIGLLFLYVCLIFTLGHYFPQECL